MGEPDSIGILDALREQKGFYAAIFFTYGVDLAFFEEAVLPPLWDSGCRRSLIFMDARRYADTIRDWRGSVTWAGLRYVLVPVDLGRWQAFHPKMALLLGDKCARMLIGSGNLTFTGFGQNHELYTCLDWTPEAPHLASVFAETWSLVNRVTERWGHSRQVRETLHTLDHLTDWVTSRSEPATDIELIHTMDAPLLEQCVRRLNSETVQSLTVVAPFIDRDAQALRKLHQHLQPKELVVVVQNGQTSGDTSALQELLSAGVPLKIRLFEGDPRYLHAKAYLMRTAHGSYLLTGSANCTQSAWLSTCQNGNMEMMLLLRHSSHPRQFDYLLHNRIGTHSVGLRAVELERGDVQPGDGRSTSLLDLTVRDGRLSVKLSAAGIPEGVRALQLRLSTVPNRSVPLEPWQPGICEIQVDIAPELREVLQKPLSASLWGVGADGEPVDLCSNELWITNVDRLRREISRLLPQGMETAGYLAEMAVGSEDGWRDLYDALVPLLMLDVADLRRRGPAYTISPNRGRRDASDSEEREGKVQLLDEAEAEANDPIAAQRYYESALHAWLEHVHARLPGTGDREMGAEKDSGRSDTPGAASDRRPARRWTPSQHTSRRFRSLIAKYIGSLDNPEYMQAIGVRHILTYYVVFQRVVQLLQRHGGIGAEDARLLATRINRGFFRPPVPSYPALIAPQRRYIHSAWEKEWLECQVPAYALASAVMCHSGSTAAEGDPADDREPLVLRVIGAVAAVVGLQRAMSACQTAAEAAQAFELDPHLLAQTVQDVVLRNLLEIAAMLDRWQRAVAAAARDSDVAPRKERHRARVDYGVAHFETLAMLGDLDGQSALWPDLVSWMHLVGEGAASQWERLVEIVSATGDKAGLSQTLLTRGQRLFYDGHHEESVESLKRAMELAIRLQDKQLKANCQRYLGYCEFFLKGKKPGAKPTEGNAR